MPFFGRNFIQRRKNLSGVRRLLTGAGVLTGARCLALTQSRRSGRQRAPPKAASRSAAVAAAPGAQGYLTALPQQTGLNPAGAAFARRPFAFLDGEMEA